MLSLCLMKLFAGVKLNVSFSDVLDGGNTGEGGEVQDIENQEAS